MRTMKKLLIFLIWCLALPVQAKHLHREVEYQTYWCSQHGGVMEYELPDKARVDCLTKEYAIEFDFAYKWAESIGQSLYYAMMTDRKPAVVLIMENPEHEQQYLKRLKTVAEKYGITVFTMTTCQ